MAKMHRDQPSLLPVFRLRTLPIRGCPLPAGGYAVTWVIRLRGRRGVIYYVPTQTPVHELLDCVVAHRTDSVDVDAGYMTADGPVVVSPVPFSALGLTHHQGRASYSNAGPSYPVYSPSDREYTAYPTLRMPYEYSTTGRDPLPNATDAGASRLDREDTRSN
jgi:hypothetical protein